MAVGSRTPGLVNVSHPASHPPAFTPRGPPPFLRPPSGLGSQAQKYRVPRIAFVNKMDRDGASYMDTAQAMEKRLGVAPLLVQMPLGEAAEFRGIVDVITQEVVRAPCVL